MANETGLPPGLPVVGGAGDGQAAGLGANVTEAGRAYLNLGTALVSGTYSDDYAWGREFRTLAGPIPRTYVPETLLRGGTYTIDWFVDNIGGIKPADLGLDLSAEQVLETAAGQVPPGAEGLLLLPYLNAASTPYWDSQARGVLFGLRGTHNKAHVYRAVLEGLAFEQRVETEAMERGLGQPVERFFAMGGGSRSPLFCQMIADITGRPVTACQEVETTCLGAAMMAADAMDDSSDLREVAATMSGEGASYEPDEQRSAFYDRIYNDVFKELYPRLSDLFPALAEAVEDQGETPDLERALPMEMSSRCAQLSANRAKTSSSAEKLRARFCAACSVTTSWRAPRRTNRTLCLRWFGQRARQRARPPERVSATLRVGTGPRGERRGRRAPFRRHRVA